MSTIDRPELALPPLVAGQRLDQRDLPRALRGDAARTGRNWSEESSTCRRRSIEHGCGDYDLGDWLGHYRRFTPWRPRGPATSTTLSGLRRGPAGPATPDPRGARAARPGSSTATSSGRPSWSSRSAVEPVARPGAKKADYERAGVLEYLFVGLDPDEVRWFMLPRRAIRRAAPGADGIYRSEVFPGLWLDPRGTLRRRPRRPDRGPRSRAWPPPSTPTFVGPAGRAPSVGRGLTSSRADRAGELAARTSSPRLRVASSTAYEIRKWVSRRLKTLPGMIRRLWRIASATNSVAVPQGARGKA